MPLQTHIIVDNILLFVESLVKVSISGKQVCFSVYNETRVPLTLKLQVLNLYSISGRPKYFSPNQRALSIEE